MGYASAGSEVRAFMKLKKSRKIGWSVAAGITLLLTLTACGSSSSPTPSSSQSIPTPILMKAFAQYWVGDTAAGPRLYREFVNLPLTSEMVKASLSALFLGIPIDSDYNSYWPSGSKINSVKISGDEAVIDLFIPNPMVSSEIKPLAIAQLVWTATAADPSLKKILLTEGGVNGKTYTREVPYAVLAPIWITSPADGALVSAVDFTLSGLASTFEANVAWRVFQKGKLIRQGSTLAPGAALAACADPARA